MKNQMRCFGGGFGLSAVLLLVSNFLSSQAVTITSPPVFSRSGTAPLAGRLDVKTDVPARITVTVNDGLQTWRHHSYHYGTNQSIPLYGFRPSRTNDIVVTVRDRLQNSYTAPNPVKFYSPAPPEGFPIFRVLENKPDKVEPGYTLFRTVNINQTIGHIIIVDNAGEVIWFSGINAGSDVTRLENGNLFTTLSSSIFELNLLGEAVNVWGVPADFRVDTHDMRKTAHDTFLYISPATRNVADFPTSATDPNAPRQAADLLYHRVVELSSTNQSVVHSWSLLDMLDPLRITYLTFNGKTAEGYDTHHSNAVLEDPRDDSVIVSIRNQNVVVKFSRQTGAIKWILGAHDNWWPEFAPYLLKPVGEPFEWNYAQHAPEITPQGTLLLYDNGNFRANPFNTRVPDSANYSRAVEYAIDEEKMEVRQVWEYGSNVPEPLYTGSVGCAELLPATGNALITFGNISYVNHARPSSIATGASMARVKEVTHDENKEVVWDLSVFNYENTDPGYRGHYVYRAHRIPDLWPHPAAPVEDLHVTVLYGTARLEFSADPARKYSIESATELGHWEKIADAELDSEGIGRFQHLDAPQGVDRFYRIITH